GSFKKSYETFPQIPDYRIVSRIGEGGMGVVYEAIQESLGRRVALKVLPSALAQDAKYVERFTREAQSAAKLHHTNIVPVFEVGGEDKTLFYAMQFIEGHSLEELRKEVARLRQSGESLAQSSISHLLGSSEHSRSSASGGSEHAQFRAYTKSVARIGVEIADALAYAHAREIIHRDVKPSNLILDQQGTVWLTDFGLAKTVDSDLTATGDVLGTIRYLAPEGFKGRADQQSDIYALGVTLFEMLTLRSPFDASNRAQLMQQIVEREPKRPRDIDERIPIDLETMLLKAIDKNHAKRYASAEQFGEDLRRFMADQPVLARRASWAEQTLRWMRRNVALTAAMLSMIVTIAILIAATFAILGQKTRSDENFERAEQQKELAEENFQLAYDAVDQFYDKVTNETLLEEPGMEGLRKTLLSEAGDFYKDLAKRRANNQALRADYVTAVYRYATITNFIESTEKAIQLLSDLVREIENEGELSEELLLSLIPVHHALGTYIEESGDAEGGLSHQQQALEYAERLVELEGESWEYQLQKCLSIGKQVRYYGNRGDFEKAYKLAQQALDILNALDLEKINDANLWMHRGLAIRLIGSIDTATGKYEDAIDAFAEAIEDYRRALELKPGSELLQRYIGVAQGGISNMQSRIGQVEQSLASNQQAINTFEELVTNHPLDSLYQYDLSNQISSLAIALWKNRDYPAALDNGLRAMRLREQLAQRFPEKIKYITRLGRIYQNVSLYYGNVENEGESENYARKAVEVSERVVELQPGSVRYRSDLSRTRSHLANLLVDQERLDEAETLIKTSWEDALSSYESNPAVIETGIAVAEASVSLGEFLLDQQKHQDALRVFDQGLEKSLKALDKAEGNTSIIRQLWPLYLGLGECLLFDGKLDKALEAKQMSSQYASDAFRKTISMLETEQLKSFIGEGARSFEETLDAIPEDLRSDEGRIQLELAFLIAAIVSHDGSAFRDDRANGRLSELTNVCVTHLEQAQSLGSLSAKDLPWIRSHPFFEYICTQPSFVEWMEKLTDNSQ
ncbi:MAG: serine/threonine-protein kinase, partial [Planctomycetota bacterium]